MRGKLLLCIVWNNSPGIIKHLVDALARCLGLLSQTPVANAPDDVADEYAAFEEHADTSQYCMSYLLHNVLYNLHENIHNPAQNVE